MWVGEDSNQYAERVSLGKSMENLSMVIRGKGVCE